MKYSSVLVYIRVFVFLFKLVRFVCIFPVNFGLYTVWVL